MKYLISLLLLTSISGCSKTVVRVSLTELPKTNQVAFVATENPIPVAFDDNETIQYLRCPGCYIVPPEDMKVLLEGK